MAAIDQTNMSGHTLEAREEEVDKHSRKICKRWKSAGVVLAEWLLTGTIGKVSSTAAAAEVEETKS